MALLPWWQGGLILGVAGGSIRMDTDGSYVQTASVGRDEPTAMSGWFEISPEGKHIGGVSLAFDPKENCFATTVGNLFLRILNIDGSNNKSPVKFPQPVGNVIFSSSGEYLAVTSISQSQEEPGLVWIQQRATQKWTLLQHDRGIGKVAISSNEKYVATSGKDNTVRVWGIVDGQEIIRFACQLPNSGCAPDIAFSPDAQWIAFIDRAGMIPNEIKICEIPSGKKIASIPADIGAHYVCFSPDGKLLAFASGNAMTIWDLTSQTTLAHMNHEIRINALAFSPDGIHLASVSKDKTAKLWRVTTGELVAQWIHENNLWELAFSPDGSYLAVAGDTCLVRVWDVQNRAEVSRLILDDNTCVISALAFSHDGKSIAVASNQGAFWIYESVPRILVTWLAHDAPVRTLDFAPGGEYVATAGGNAVYLWHVQLGCEAEHLVLNANSIAFSPNGKYVVAAGGIGEAPTGEGAGVAVIWDLSSGREAARVPNRTVFHGVAIHRESRYLATIDHSSTVRIWEIENGVEKPKVMVQGVAYALDFNSATGHLVTGSWESEHLSTCTMIQVWDETGQELKRHRCTLIAKRLRLSPDGTLLALAGYGGVQLWRVNSLGDERAELVAYFPQAGSVNDIAFTNDGNHLAMAGSDKTARVIEIATAQEIAHVNHLEAVLDVCFSPDGKFLATASKDESAAIWLWRPEDLIAQAQARLTRNLTPSEWRQHFGSDVPYELTQPGLLAGRDPAFIPQRVIEPFITQNSISGEKRAKNPLSLRA